MSKVKLAMLKQANEGKRKVVRIGMTKKILEKIMKACYRKNFKEVIPEKKKVFPYESILFSRYEEV